MHAIPRAHISTPPNIPLLRALWSLLDGIWGVLKGSWGVLVELKVMIWQHLQCPCIYHTAAWNLWEWDQLPRRDLNRSMFNSLSLLALMASYHRARYSSQTRSQEAPDTLLLSLIWILFRGGGAVRVRVALGFRSVQRDAAFRFAGRAGSLLYQAEDP